MNFEHQVFERQWGDSDLSAQKQPDANNPDSEWAAQVAVHSSVTAPRISLEAAQLQQLSPAALAYLGDAVYELYIRTWYLLPPQRLQRYHSCVVSQVRAESQARHLCAIEPQLTLAELEIVRRGRNAASKHPRKTDPEIYQQASSLETLVGYLYLIDPQRLHDLLTQISLI